MKALLGHKTFAMVGRFSNVTAEDVVRALHADTRAATPRPAASASVDEAPHGGSKAEPVRPDEPVPDNVVHVTFGRPHAP